MYYFGGCRQALSSFFRIIFSGSSSAALGHFWLENGVFLAAAAPLCEIDRPRRRNKRHEIVGKKFPARFFLSLDIVTRIRSNVSVTTRKTVGCTQAAPNSKFREYLWHL